MVFSAAIQSDATSRPSLLLTSAFSNVASLCIRAVEGARRPADRYSRIVISNGELCTWVVMLARMISLSSLSNTTNAGRCFDPTPLVKGNAIRTTSPGSNVVINAVAVTVAAEELLRSQTTPIGLFGPVR